MNSVTGVIYLRELSLHILDLITNSIEAEATRVILVLEEDATNIFRIRIRDNGRGMTQEILEKVFDPFFTSRTNREVGLGLPLLLAAARRCNGDVQIQSKEGLGTTVTATFQLDHIDRAPLGDLPSTIINLIAGAPGVHLVYIHRVQNRCFKFDSFWIAAQMAERGEENFYSFLASARQYLLEKLTNIRCNTILTLTPEQNFSN